MYCSKCGKEIPEGSRFCNYCGEAISQKTSADAEENWEYCQIVFDGKHNFWLGGWDNVHFWASAVGKNGTYSAGSSPPYRISAYLAGPPPCGIREEDGNKAADAHNLLVQKLISDGWENIPSKAGSAWWQLQFRRRIKT